MTNGVRRAFACLMLILTVAACAHRQTGWTPEQEAANAADTESFREGDMEMRRLFPPGNEGSEEARREAATRLVEAYAVRRRQRGLPELHATAIESNITFLAAQPVRLARLREMEATQQATETSRQQVAAIVASFDGRQVSPLELTRAASALVEREQPDTRGMDRRSAITQAEAELRRAIEARRSTQAQAAAQRRETDLARMAATNLADMPREIVRAAEQNLVDARPPFDTRANWRIDAAALRQEEVRLRDAVARRLEYNRRDAEASAQAAAHAARRDAVVQQCRMQAAMMGAAVPSPYMGGGFGGAIASGIVGAMRQAEMEGNALQACLRASGY